MKNLKKLSREAKKQINGGIGPLKRCSETSPCIIGWCCEGICKEYACIEA